MDSKEEVVKKKNKCMAKKKERLVKLNASVKFLLSSCPEFSLFLLPCSLPAPLPALMSALVLAPLLAPVSYLRSFAVLLSGCVPALTVFTALFLLYHAFISNCKISALLLLLFVLGSPLFLGPSLLRTFKQFLSDELWPRMSTSSAKCFCPFLALSMYNPDDNNNLYNSTNSNKCKQDFNMMFINSRLLASNHDQREVDLSIASCRYPTIVKLN